MYDSNIHILTNELKSFTTTCFSKPSPSKFPLPFWHVQLWKTRFWIWFLYIYIYIYVRFKPSYRSQCILWLVTILISLPKSSSNWYLGKSGHPHFFPLFWVFIQTFLRVKAVSLSCYVENGTTKKQKASSSRGLPFSPALFSFPLC